MFLDLALKRDPCEHENRGRAEAFRAFAPDDPARYDFAITRLGIRPDADLDAFLDAYGVERSD